MASSWWGFVRKCQLSALTCTQSDRQMGVFNSVLLCHNLSSVIGTWLTPYCLCCHCHVFPHIYICTFACPHKWGSRLILLFWSTPTANLLCHCDPPNLHNKRTTTVFIQYREYLHIQQHTHISAQWSQGALPSGCKSVCLRLPTVLCKYILNYYVLMCVFMELWHKRWRRKTEAGGENKWLLNNYCWRTLEEGIQAQSAPVKVVHQSPKFKYCGWTVQLTASDYVNLKTGVWKHHEAADCKGGNTIWSFYLSKSSNTTL